MKTELDVPQGSPEWLKLRHKYITASNVPALMGVSEYKTPLQYWTERQTKSTLPVSASTQRIFDQGHAIERKGIDYINKVFHLNLRPKVFVREDLGLLASLDGYSVQHFTQGPGEPDMIGQTIIAEIKGVGKARFLEIQKSKRVPEEHYLQIQAQLLVTGADECLYYVESLFDDREFDILTIKPSSKTQERIVAAVSEFRELTEPPAPTYLDKLTTEEGEMRLIAKLKSENKELDKRIKENSDAIDAMVHQLFERHQEYMILENDSVSIRKYFVKGRINYTDIPALNGLDLEPYRSKSTISTRVTLKENAQAPKIIHYDDNKP